MQNVTNILIYHFSSLYFQSWIVHCLDLVLKDWGKKTKVKRIVKKVKAIVFFIWQYHVPLTIFYRYETNLMLQNSTKK
jgi:hypothetical protein